MVQSIMAQHLPFVQYLPQDGLSSSTVYEIRQTPDGKIWIATEGGLNSYDGYEFRAYTTDHGLPDNDIFGLYPDPAGRLWLVSVGRLTVFDPQTASVIATIAHPRANFSFGIHDGIAHLIVFPNTGNVTPLNFRLDLHAGDFQQMAMDMRRFNGGIVGAHQGKPVARTFHGIATPSLAPLSATPKGGKQSSRAQTQFIEQNPTVLATTDGHLETFVTRRYGAALRKLFPGGTELRDRILLARDSSLWYARVPQGLFRWQPGQLDATPELPRRSNLEGSFISRIFEDTEGNIWVGTVGEGLFFLPARSRFCTNYSADGPSGKSSVRALAPLPDEGVMLGISGQQVGYFRDGGVEYRRLEKDDWSFVRIRKAMAMGRDTVLMCTDGGGLLEVVSGTQVKVRQVGGMATKDMLRVGEDVWVAASSGLYQFEGGTRGKALKHRLAGEKGLQFVLYALAHDAKRSRLFLGSTEGLLCYDLKAEKLVELTGRDSVLNRRITALAYAEATDILWVGIDGKGIAGFRMGEKGYAGKFWLRGWMGNAVYKLLPVGKNLWVGGNKGLSFARNAGERQAVTVHLDRRHGLRGEEIFDLAQRGAMVYAGSNLGFSVIDTAILKVDSTRVPRVYIEEVRLFDAPLPDLDGHTLSQRQNNLSFRFGAIHFVSQQA
ncbi:MAG: two-component regulator propeller domain-containing protein, partial [Bacteroidota bacterium]